MNFYEEKSETQDDFLMDNYDQIRKGFLKEETLQGSFTFVVDFKFFYFLLN